MIQNIKNNILDYGNVIFMIDFQKCQNAFEKIGITHANQFFGHKNQHEIFDMLDKGIATRQEFFETVRSITNKPELSDEQILQAWNSILIGVQEGTHELLVQLKSSYRTFLLSNNNEMHYEQCMKHIKEKYDVENNDMFFEKTYYSHLVGMRKPDENIFIKVLEENNLDPNQTLFIDDSPQHLKTAESLGIHTERCSAERPLERILKELQLLG